MSSEDTLHLSNSNLIQTHTKFYNELLESQEMSDVTLACDGYEIGAHKTIISASSEFFKEVIKKSKHANPYIYIKGVSKETLETILKFIYVGEATARTDNLERLVEAGNELKVFGLMEEAPKKEMSVSNKKPLASSVSVDISNESVGSEQNEASGSDINVTDFVKIEHFELEEADESKDESRNEESKNQTMKEESKDESMYEESKGESDSARLMTEINKRITTNVDDLGNESFKCNVCEREFATIGYIRPHIELHLEGFSYKCNFCDVVKSTRKRLNNHQRKVHNHHQRFRKSVNNETSNIKKHNNKDNEDEKTSTEAELNMDVVIEEEVRKADDKIVNNIVVGETESEVDMEAVTEEVRTAVSKGSKKNNEDNDEDMTNTESEKLLAKRQKMLLEK